MSKEIINKNNLAQFKSQAYMNLETYRKNGDGVKTPVWFVQEGRTFYVRTGKDSWKVKRLRNNPRASIVPSTRSGGPLGEWVPVTAELVMDEMVADEVNQKFNHKYGLQKRFFDLMGRIQGDKLATLKISADESS